MSVAFRKDGKLLAVGAGKTVRLLGMPTGKELAALTHADSVWCVAFAPDGKTLAAGYLRGAVKLWDVGGLAGASK
jgi:WD40 repeat protein